MTATLDLRAHFLELLRDEEVRAELRSIVGEPARSVERHREQLDVDIAERRIAALRVIIGERGAHDVERGVGHLNATLHPRRERRPPEQWLRGAVGSQPELDRARCRRRHGRGPGLGLACSQQGGCKYER